MWIGFKNKATKAAGSEGKPQALTWPRLGTNEPYFGISPSYSF